MPYPPKIEAETTDGSRVTIEDGERFCRHLQEFHRSGTSIHTERGLAFRVDEAFRRAVQAQAPGITLFG
jgi:hypothetical protein